MKLKLHEEVTYIKPGTKKLLTPEELFLKDSQNNRLVPKEEPVLAKTVNLVLSAIWR